MPVGRTPMNADKEARETGTFIDMSRSIITPDTHHTSNPLSETPTVLPSEPTGAIPKTFAPPKTFNFPPPKVPHNQKGFSSGNSPRAYAGLIRELIAENVKGYRSELEEKLDKKIQESLEEGFAKMISEIQKM
ncbi:hypothetical protein FF38_10993, partial [Lucilia cuprina]